MQKIKKYCKDNIHIKITGFELLDVSIYGCDARFEFEIRDNETDALLDTDFQKVENAFMGVDDSEEYELQNYNDMYHDWFFEAEEEEQEGIIEKIMDELYLPKGLFYVVKGDSAEWIEAKFDYFGVHLNSDTLDIRKVYYKDMEDWIYEVDGVLFNITSDGSRLPDFDIEFFDRDEE